MGTSIHHRMKKKKRKNSLEQKLLVQEIHAELLHPIISHPVPVWLCPHHTTKKLLKRLPVHCYINKLNRHFFSSHLFYS